MRQAGLIFNPKAGRGLLFESVRGELTRVLAAHGFDVLIWATTDERESARELAVAASRRCELVIACGGDGTVHGVLQGMAGTQASVGVLPFGTANALARDLRLPMDVTLALKKILRFTAREIPLGYAETERGRRWFVVMAGAGPDGRLVHEMKLAAKGRLGRRAYYVEAARLFMTRHFPAFAVTYRLVGSSAWESRLAVAVMASRVANLGGLFRGLTSTCRLDHSHLRVQMLAAPAQLALPAWMALGKAGLGRANPWLTTVDVEEIRCLPLRAEQQIYAQVDGEAVGVLPMRMGVVPSALRLLMP